MLLDTLNKGVAQIDLSTSSKLKEELVGSASHSGAMEQVAT